MGRGVQDCTPLFVWFGKFFIVTKLIEYLEQFVTSQRKSIFRQVLENRTRYITVVVEDVYQSHNASAIIRTCEGVGIQDVRIIEKRNTFEVNPHISLGASKWLTIKDYHDTENPIIQSINELKSNNYRIVATVPDESAVKLDDFDLNPGKTALFFGTELTGLSSEAIDFADEYLYIPMYGFTRSFNVSVSAAVILYTLIRKLHTSDLKWKLEENDKELIYYQWLKQSVKKSDEIEKAFLAENNNLF